MERSQLPLNALRAFEASARHLSFTRAAEELCVTQAAVSHQIKALEERIGAPLFRRLARGLALTEEGQALMPVVGDSIDRLCRVMSRFESGAVRDVLAIGVVGTFAVRWLMPRLALFQEAFPLIELRCSPTTTRSTSPPMALTWRYVLVTATGLAWRQTCCFEHRCRRSAPLHSPADSTRRRLFRGRPCLDHIDIRNGEPGLPQHKSKLPQFVVPSSIRSRS